MAHITEQRPAKKAKAATALPLKSALKKPKANPAPNSSQAKPLVPDSVLEDSDSQKQATVKKSTEIPKVTKCAPTSPPAKVKAKADKGKVKVVPEPASEVYPSTFKIVVGTYEKLLYGLEGSFIGEDGGAQEKPTLKPVFIFPAHVGYVKAVAASPDGGRWLATGSTDEIIKVWDLRRKKEIGDLIQHEGSITYLDFPTRSHLVSASEDGTICIFRARDWVLLRTMKGHKGRVNSVAVHPSGKVGLSVGKDRTLRMWDLIRGKGSASTKLGKEGETVRWSVDGSRFVVHSGSTLDIYSTHMVLLQTTIHPKRVQDVRFYRDSTGEEYLLVASEDKKVTIYKTKSEDSITLPIVAEAVGHDNRVKAIDTLVVATPHSNSDRSQTTIMCSVSSDGWIRLFDLGALDSSDVAAVGEGIKRLEALVAYDTKGSRLTCCTLGDGESSIASVTGKRKHEDDVSNDEIEVHGEQTQRGESEVSEDEDENKAGNT